MMTKPGITELDKCVDSRYTLVSMVAKRARMIGTQRNAGEADASASMEKPVTQAVNEISSGVIGYIRPSTDTFANQSENESAEV